MVDIVVNLCCSCFLHSLFIIIDVFKKEKVRMSSPSYVEEQQALKESFKDALGDNSDDEDIFKIRPKTKEEQVNLRYNLFVNVTWKLMIKLNKSL